MPNIIVKCQRINVKVGLFEMFELIPEMRIWTFLKLRVLLDFETTGGQLVSNTSRVYGFLTNGNFWNLVGSHFKNNMFSPFKTGS